jgi:hypothetical protein
MNRIAFTLLTLLFTSAIWGQTLSTNPTGATPLSSVAGPGDTYYGPAPAAGDHVPGQLVIHFNQPKTDPSDQTAFKNDLTKENASLVAFSPMGGYALVQIDRLTNSNDACELIGEGNTLLEAIGAGDGGDLNYIMGTDYIDNASGRGYNYEDYEINGECSSEYPIIPDIDAGNALVRIGVIDGGMYARYGRTKINEVTVYQKVFSSDGSTNSNLTPGDYSSHGRAILALISGTFRSQNLHSQLSLESYKVMDKNLRATVFDVASAMEYAAEDGRRRPQILTISIGFKPAFCSEYSDGGVVENSILREAIKTAQRYGILVFTSAGNDGRSLETHPQYPAATADVFTNVVTVGSISCYGDNPTVWSNFSSSLVDFLTVGDKVSIIDNGEENLMTGTSFSTPVVAAKAGLHIASMSSPSYPFRPTNVLCALYQQTVPSAFSLYGILDASAYRGEYCPIVTPGGGGGGPVIIDPDGGDLGTRGTLRISPNPVINKMSLAIGGDVWDGATLSLMDSGGNLIINKKVHSNKFDLNLDGLRPGMYWVSVRSSAGIETKRIVKR